MAEKTMRTMNRAETLKVAAWIEAHYAELKGKTKKEVLDTIHADTGIWLSETGAVGFFEDMGKETPWAGRRASPNAGGVDRTRALSYQVLNLLKELEKFAGAIGHTEFNAEKSVRKDVLSALANGNTVPEDTPRTGL